MNREQWLAKCRDALRPWFKQRGYPIPDKVNVTCGFPSKRATGKTKVIGQCWQPEASTFGAYEIFISPLIDEAAEVGATLAHELGHACLPGGSAHRQPFKRMMEAVGLEGEAKATNAGKELAAHIKGIMRKHGPYPHGRLNILDKEKKQTTRLLKVKCPTCGYTCRVTRQWLDTGLPVCPDGTEMEED